MLDTKTYWLIGASEGLGRALATALDAEGARLILSARSAERLASLAETLTDAQVLPLDVTDPQAARAAANVAQADGLIYCAGAYDPVDASDWNAPAVARMNGVNYMGAANVLAEIAPRFAAQGAGHIVLIGSLAAFRGLPGAIGYSASKAALSSLGESLFADLTPRGVRVQIIHPGFIDTRLTQKNGFAMPQIMSPDDAATRTIRAMRRGGLHHAFPAPFSWLFTLGRFLPPRLFYALMRRS